MSISHSSGSTWHSRLKARMLLSGTLARTRLLTCLVACFSAIGLLIPISFDSGSAALRGAAGFAALALALWWMTGFRRGRFALAGEPLEAAAMFLILWATPGHPLLPLCGLLFRSLYGGVRLAAVRLVAWSGALLAAGSLQDSAAIGRDLPLLFALMLATAAMQGLRLALTRLEASEQRLGSLIEHSSDVVTVLDSDGRINWQARSITPVLGYDYRDWLGTRFTDHAHPADRARLESYISRTQGRPRSSEVLEVRLYSARGQERWFEIAASNRLHDPSVRGLVLNIRDATDRRRLEGLRAESARLRERVTIERERRDLQARLQQAQRLEAIGALAGGVAHDFNNLLAVILNCVSSLRQELPEDHDAFAEIDLIARAAETGAQLTEKLLAFGRRRPNQAQLVDTSEVIAAMDKLLARPLGGHIEVRQQLQPDTWPVSADPTDIEQIVLNLAINARDAIGADGGEITIETENTSLADAEAGELGIPPGEYVRLSVRDTGCGIDADTLSHVWDPYFTTKPVGQGSGLGLATVHGIAHQAGGTVAIRSAPGAGTLVQVYLPAAWGCEGEQGPSEGGSCLRAQTADPTSKPAESASVTTRRDDRLRVVLVEPEGAMREVMRGTLERAGYEVMACETADHALVDMGRGDRTDLLITAVVMQGIWGDDLAARIRRARPEMPVIYTMGLAERYLAAVPTAARSSILTKPFGAVTLLREVNNLIRACGDALAA